MSYTIIIPTMSYSWTFKLCLDSLVNSDFPGQIIVVEEGNSTREICKDYLPKGIGYIKSKEFTGPDNAVELGLLQAKCDRIIYSHNDAIFFPTWFSEFQEQIKKVPPKYFGMLNIAYDQVLMNEEHKTITDLRKAINDKNTVFKTKLYGNSSIGLANDLWSDNRVARMSVVACFLKKDCESILPFISGCGFDWELHWLYAKTGRLNLTTKLSQPIIHLNNEYGFGTDTQRYKQKYLEIREKSYAEFGEKYGVDVNQFLDSYFGNMQFDYKEVISEAIDNNNFDLMLELSGELLGN